jgi:putative endonuclease
VAEDEQDLIFVEVKARRGVSFGLPEDALTISKRRKLVEVASSYLDLHAPADHSWSIDVVAVQFNSGGRLEEIRIYKHAVTDI